MSNFRCFHNSASSFTTKSPETSKFSRIITKPKTARNLMMWDFFISALWKNYTRYRANFLQKGSFVQFLQNITSPYPLKNILLMSYYTNKKLIFTLLQKWPQTQKQLKNKGQHHQIIFLIYANPVIFAYYSG